MRPGSGKDLVSPEQKMGRPLARVANSGNSTLHHRFKALTAMSPLQYQKQLRLQEARRLMINEGLDVSSACYRVGYESPSQFSRQYTAPVWLPAFKRREPGTPDRLMQTA